jgi:hypothetical protein
MELSMLYFERLGASSLYDFHINAAGVAGGVIW